MNGLPYKTLEQVGDDCAQKIIDCLGPCVDESCDDMIAAHVRDAINEYVPRYSDRLTRAIRVVESGGSFGLTEAQKRILLDLLWGRS